MLFRIFIIIAVFLYFNTLVLAQDEEVSKADISIIKYRGFPDVKINNIKITRKGLIYVCTDIGLYLLDPANSDSDLKYEGRPVFDIIELGEDLYLAAGNSIVNLFNKQETALPSKGVIKDLAYDKNKIWIASTSGLYSFTPRNGKLQTFRASNTELETNKINFVHKDRHEIVWVGTDQGYLRIEEDKWELEDKKYRMLNTHENKEGQWIVSEDDLFLINEYNRLFPVGLDEEFHQGDVRDFTIDSKGKIYLASEQLVRYDPYEEVVHSYTVEDGINISSACSSIEIDLNDNVWIGTESDGLYVIQFSDNFANNLSVNIVLQKPISCYGKSDAIIEAIVSGGLAPYTYEWQNSLEDGNQLMNIGKGEYAVIITDATGLQFKSTLSINEPEELVIQRENVQQMSGYAANDGSVTLNVEGGTGSKIFTWNNGDNTPSINDLKSGDYSIVIEDQNGCSLERTYSIDPIKILPSLNMNEITVGTTLRLEQLYFAADSSNLEAPNFPVLDEVYDFLTQNPQIVIEVGGHTNTIPPHSYCDRLSTARAKSVANYLTEKGIKNNRISYVGYGKRQPLTEDTSQAGRQKNQRVELKIIEI